MGVTVTVTRWSKRRRNVRFRENTQLHFPWIWGLVWFGRKIIYLALGIYLEDSLPRTRNSVMLLFIESWAFGQLFIILSVYVQQFTSPTISLKINENICIPRTSHLSLHHIIRHPSHNHAPSPLPPPSSQNPMILCNSPPSITHQPTPLHINPPLLFQTTPRTKHHSARHPLIPHLSLTLSAIPPLPQPHRPTPRTSPRRANRHHHHLTAITTTTSHRHL